MRGDSGQLREFTPIYHPAGFDTELRGALEDVQARRWRTTRELLAHTGADWALRTSRTQVLAAAAARSDVIEAWLGEEPHNPDALLMLARVSVERTLQAHRSGHPGTPALLQEAQQACDLAIKGSSSADPVPWITLLALAQADARLEYPWNWWAPWEPMLPAGPWGLLRAVHERDWGNREAYHRMHQFLYACPHTSNADALGFAQWVTSWAPEGSPLRILPLYSRTENYRRHREDGTADPLSHRQWSREPVIWDVHRAFQGWNADSGPVTSVGDLNYLAHALWAAHQYIDAAKVFLALDRYATRLPWAYVTDDPASAGLAVREFVRARSECLSPARSRTAGGTARRPRPV
ncbi:hypothetical protein [Streptomyces violascens]|uniref:DUF4034 domain-containing protein n=1 Tax=Streptomyces violascens TaxID=67381 RepID=A0ABQ3QV79_9ACTN|nr:hypothetical protein [Streptomyces violascens]GGU43953.1 hypothetical protein GCM10010289_75760 [Streptomyces violascens]GHI41143.1 hypothetical protein Sviol_55510 [Streptomyces violascens]